MNFLCMHIVQKMIYWYKYINLKKLAPQIYCIIKISFSQQYASYCNISQTILPIYLLRKLDDILINWILRVTINWQPLLLNVLYYLTCNRFATPHLRLLIHWSWLQSLTRRRHDIRNSLGDETSCESSIPLAYSTLNVLVPNGQWVLAKTPLKFYAHLIYY